ncbi:MAG TPA: hypothetical protein VH722_15690, partial [Alphaproteobacteria bacterium]|nr:hypothetical protein [Alphaproteobacteria bacterium]
MRKRKSGLIFICLLSMLLARGTHGDATDNRFFPYTTDSFADFTEAIIGPPFWGIVRNVLSDDEKQAADRTRLVVARRSVGLPVKCRDPSHIAYSEAKADGNEITVCSNNFLFFARYITEFVGISMVKPEFIDDGVVDRYLGYFALYAYRQKSAMQAFPTPIEFPCS